MHAQVLARRMLKSNKDFLLLLSVQCVFRSDDNGVTISLKLFDFFPNAGEERKKCVQY